ncbi:hypothetical protein [Listeria monocytogenes]|uniref:hypothetical protein n=1 Tax=Listeria monocytogenes TaxID=1639 RepID=UPI0002EDC136|nr:hypothetical protein [Listeria monocytogenes]
MEIREEIIIDKKVYDEAYAISTGYSEVVLESNSTVVQLSKLSRNSGFNATKQRFLSK